MSVIERDVILQSQDKNGNETIDLPITRLGNIEDTADVKGTPGAHDYIPIVDGDDNGQMKKVPASALMTGASTAVVPFQASEWGPPASVTVSGTYDGASGYELSIPAARHKCGSGDFIFQIFHLVGGKYTANTWGAVSTEVRYDAATGNIILASSDRYSGKILFVC